MQKRSTTIRAAVCLLCLPLSAATGCREAQELRLLVGTFTERSEAEGLYYYSFDTRTADFQLLGIAASGNPSMVTVHPEGRIAWSVNEFYDGRQGVSAYEFDRDSIRLAGGMRIPSGPVDGRGPCNLLFTGDALVSANYGGGSLTAFPLDVNGIPEEPSQWATGGLEKDSRMHCSVLSPDGRYIFVTDLGNDCIHRFERGPAGYPLGAASIAWKGGNGYGPRHMVFSPDGRHAYLVCELSDRLLAFSYENGALTLLQDIKAYDGNGGGGADIHITPDGRFLYTSHRLDNDGLACFAVNPGSGRVERAGYTPTGRHPRNFAISPDGRYLLCACRGDNRIEIYAIDAKTGALTHTGKNIEVPSPVCVIFTNI